MFMLEAQILLVLEMNTTKHFIQKSMQIVFDLYSSSTQHERNSYSQQRFYLVLKLNISRYIYNVNDDHKCVPCVYNTFCQ